MLIQSSFYWVLYCAGTVLSTIKVYAIATSCQVYPSEYAYHDDSVAEQESVSANCRRYQSGLQVPVFTEQYTHCDGIRLKLIDSDLGQEQYLSTDYYVWPTGDDAQLLFIFPELGVSLTTITLHYYSDRVQGLPRLSFYAVPDDFDVWDLPTISYLSVGVASVTPGGEPAGRRSVSINVNFNTKKVLMYITLLRRTFMFSVSEVEFFTCRDEATTTSTSHVWSIHTIQRVYIHSPENYTHACTSVCSILNNLIKKST